MGFRFLWIGVFVCGVFAGRLDSVVLQLPGTVHMGDVGFLAAVQKGFYAEQGLDVHIQYSEPKGSSLDALIFGKADFSYAESDLFHVWSIGKPVVSLSVILQKSPRVLLTKSDVTIPSQLIHRKIAMDASTDLEMVGMFLSQGISMDSLQIVSSADPFTDFMEGRVDAFVASLYNEPERLLRLKADFNVLRPDRYGFDFYGSSIITSRQNLEDHPDRVVRFIKASLKGWQYVLDNENEAIGWILAQSKSAGDVPHLKFEFEGIRELMQADHVVLGSQELSLWNADAQRLVALGLVSRDLDLYHKVENIEDIEKDQRNQLLRWALIVAGIALFIAVVFSAFAWWFWQGVRKRGDALRKSEARLKKALKATPDAVWELPNLQDPMWWSPGAYLLFGQDQRTFQPTWHAMLELLQPEDRIVLDEDMHSAMDTCSAFVRDVRIKHEAGLQWLRIRGLASDEDGATRMSGYFQDIHELKATEIARRESETQFRQYFELGLVGLATVDLTGRFLQVNKTLWEMLDSNEETLSSQDWRMFTHPGDLALEEELMESVLRGERQGYTIDKRFVTTGSKRTVYALVAARAVLRASGQVSHWVMLIQDITQRRQGEQEKEKILHQLSLKNRTLEGMLHTISHDFRHPLVNVMWYSQEVDKNISELLAAAKSIPDESYLQLPPLFLEAMKAISDDLPHSLSEIRRGAQVLDRMLGGMLSLSRLGRQPVDFLAVDMRQLVQAILDETRTHVEQIKAQIDVGELPMCMGSEAMLYQVWKHLLDNALQFRDPARPLLVKVHGKLVRDWVVYTIEDNGIGIPTSSLGHIFAPFFRLESSNSSGGEGLGLTFVTRILESHRGHIKVESDLGKGTRFSVYLPKAPDSSNPDK